MPGLNFYDANTLRAYPLLAGTPGESGVPAGAIVDFGSTAGVHSGYAPAADSAYLASISRSGSALTFAVASTCAGLSGAYLLFRRRADDDPWTTQRAVATNADGTAYLSDPCGTLPAWSGYLVTGRLDGLLALLADGDTLAGGPAFAFEPCLTRSDAGARVRAVNVGNAGRLRVGDSGPYTPTYFANGTCLVGPLTAVPGYNCSLLQNPAANSLTVSASAGAGAGEPCGEVPVHAGEAPPDGSIYLTGGPSCADLVTSINGLSASHLKLVGRGGVNVRRDVFDTSLIHVSISLQSLSSCPGPPEAEMGLVAIPPQISRSY